MTPRCMKVFIAGIGGFVGAQMTRWLLDNGASVLGLIGRRAAALSTVNYIGPVVQRSCE